MKGAGPGSPALRDPPRPPATPPPGSGWARLETEYETHIPPAEGTFPDLSVKWEVCHLFLWDKRGREGVC